MIEQEPLQEGRNMSMLLAPARRGRRGRGQRRAERGPDASERRRRALRTRRRRLPQRPSHAAVVCFNSRPMPKMKTHSGHQEAVSQDRHRQAARPARLLQPHPREEVAEAKAAHGASRPRSRRPTTSACARCSPGRARAHEPRHQRRRAQAAQEEGPEAGEGLLGPQALELPARQRAGHALGRLRLPRPPHPQARLPPPLDHADQRRRPARGHELLASSSTASSEAGVEVNRKMLADIAVHDPEAFRRFAELAREATAA